MGASSSVDKPSPAQQEEESLAASTGSLPMLQNVFAKLSSPESKAVPVKSLQDILSLNIKNLLAESLPVPECFPQLLNNLGPSIVGLFFDTDQEYIHWVDFLRGYNRCCGRMPASSYINNLCKLYSTSGRETGIGSEMIFGSDTDGGKVSGNLKLSDLLLLLWTCWIMSQSAKILKICKGSTALILPDISHLITSAYISCNEVGDELNVRDCKSLGFEKDISVQKLHLWILTTVPGLAHCLMQYVQDRFHACVTSEDELDSSILLLSDSSVDYHDTCLLTCGRAWAISLTFRDTVNEELSRSCFPRKSTETLDGLLYRSSLHGKGLNRFWSNVEGYRGPLLLVLSANSADTTGGESSCGQWVIGILTAQGFENKDTFYGGSGCLYALSPVFRVFSPSGRDKNFVYTHLHPSVRVYDPHPKPVGLAFGGVLGNERIFIDEDFSRVTVRHHAMDKTYQSGPLIPNQGFLATEAFILDFEVWGLGGKAMKDYQDAYKRREQLFSEQRRKVDLKTFASWEDSPEKMMLNMMADPNRVQREDR
uniref:TLD domain-containing protein KIAA1609 n=1 Tax=Anthurium amnicola TaxID=1678845 RepID=A0A1D1XE75_9ARAE